MITSIVTLTGLAIGYLGPAWKIDDLMPGPSDVY